MSTSITSYSLGPPTAITSTSRMEFARISSIAAEGQEGSQAMRSSAKLEWNRAARLHSSSRRSSK